MSTIKQKAIIPSLREKKRYLAYRIISENNMINNEVRNAIEQGCHYFLGQLDYSKAGVSVMPDGKNGLIRVNNKYLNKVRAGMTLIDNINNERVIIETIGVSGMLNKAKKLLGKASVEINEVKIGG